jgi:predicted SAM-dependent methyltransferase
MNETSKANKRRRNDPFYDNLFKLKNVLDIGGGMDPWPKSAVFDKDHGDANYIKTYLGKSKYEMVYSSHCLEHMNDPEQSLKDWYSLVEDGGFLFVVVPDFDLYEYGEWPSRFGQGHLHAFSMVRESNDFLINVKDLVKDYNTLQIRLCDTNYNYKEKKLDQTLGDAEANIEIIIEK